MSLEFGPNRQGMRERVCACVCVAAARCMSATLCHVHHLRVMRGQLVGVQAATLSIYQSIRNQFSFIDAIGNNTYTYIHNSQYKLIYI